MVSSNIRYDKVVRIIEEVNEEYLDCPECHSSKLNPLGILVLDQSSAFVKYKCAECGSICNDGEGDFAKMFPELWAKIQELNGGFCNATIYDVDESGEHLVEMITIPNTNLSRAHQVFVNLDLIVEGKTHIIDLIPLYEYGKSV